MSDNREELLNQLEAARRELQNSQERVATLEYQLREAGVPVITSLSNTHYQPTLDSLIEGCQIIGFDWRYLFINQAAAQQGNKTQAELIGRTMMECYPGIDNTEMFDVLRHCMENRQSADMENEFAFPEGKRGWFELHIQPIPTGIFILSLDITERKVHEMALQRYAQRMRILHQIDLGIISATSVLDVVEEALKHIRPLFDCQQTAVVLFDFAANEILFVAGNTTIPSAISKGDRYPMWPGILEEFGTGTISVIDDIQLASDANPSNRRVKREGMRSSLRVLLKFQGHPMGVLILNADTPHYFTVEHQEVAIEVANQLAIAIQQLRLSDALNTSEQRYRSVVEVQSDMICRYKADLTIVFVNRAYSEMFGSVPEAIIGRNLRDLIAPEELAGFLAHIEVVLTADAAVTRESPYIYPDGTTHWIQWQDRVLKDEHGQISEYQGVGRDITERRNAEHELKALYNATTYLLKADNLLSLSSQIVEAVIQEFAQVNCELLLVDKPRGSIVRLAHKGSYPIQPDVPLHLDKQGLVQRAIHTGEVVYIPDLDRQPNYASAGDATQSELVIPLKTGRGVLAVLDLKHNSVDAFSERDQRILVTYAERAAVALENMQLYDTLDRYAAHLEQRVTQRTEELQSAKDRVEAILNNSPNAIVLVNRDLRIQQANSSFYKLFGYRLEDGFDTSVTALVQPKDVDLITQAFRATRVEGQSSTLEVHAQRNDHSTFDADVSLALSKGTGFVCTFRDITESKTRERQLRFHASIQESVRDAVIVTDMQFRIQSWNKAAEATYGWSASEVNSQSISLLRTESEAVADRVRLPQEFMTGSAWQGEVIQYRKDGRPINVMASVNHVKDENGVPFGIVAVNRDVTERKRAEAALRDSEERFRQYFELPLIGMSITSLDKGWLQVNDKLCDMLGYPRVELIQKTWEEITHPDDVEADLALYRDLIAGEIEGYSLDKRFIHKDGRFIYVTITIRAVRKADGQVNYFVGLMQDITERKKSEATLQQALAKEKELSELKSRFVSMASHEFRTPLATILTITDLLSHYRQKMTEDQIQQRLGRIQEQIRYLTEIMDDVLQLARLQARRAEFNPAPLDLVTLCQHVIDEFTSRPDLVHQIAFEYPHALPLLNLDRKLIRQILNNLISNAIKYSPEKTPITINLRQTDDATILQVSDQGIGIPQADMEHLFEPFHRANNVGTIAGTGLGLTITKESVELHGGTITVESYVNNGTTFTIILPNTLEDKP